MRDLGLDQIAADKSHMFKSDTEKCSLLLHFCAPKMQFNKVHLPFYSWISLFGLVNCS